MRKSKEIQPCDSARKWAAFYIEEKFNIMWSYRNTVLQDHDPEIIHDMRVASRRLRAVLADFRSCIPKTQYKIILAITKKITEQLGAIRDMDILDEQMTAMADETRPERISTLHLLQERTAIRRLNAQERLSEFFGHLDEENFPQEIITLTGLLRHG